MDALTEVLRPLTTDEVCLGLFLGACALQNEYPTLIWRNSPALDLVCCNAAFSRETGYSQEEVANDLIHVDLVPSWSSLHIVPRTSYLPHDP
mmetsp:Transcript_12901/g.32924  ORF Transcript_12901/g.32924 Transcript_12901/m.32924 type:complete len:92 (-) Transcript_12901:819-1094(-)